MLDRACAFEACLAWEQVSSIDYHSAATCLRIYKCKQVKDDSHAIGGMDKKVN